MPIPLNLVASNYRAERNIISHQTRKAVITDIKSNQPHACLKKYIFPSTCVSALREIHQSLQCKIFQYTFHRQYPMKFSWFLFAVQNLSASLATT